MLVLGNGKVITRDPACPLIENGAVAVDGTAICRVGRTEEIRNAYPDAEYIDAKGGLIMNIFTAHLQEGFLLKDMIRKGSSISWMASGGPLTGISPCMTLI